MTKKNHILGSGDRFYVYDRSIANRQHSLRGLQVIYSRVSWHCGVSISFSKRHFAAHQFVVGACVALQRTSFYLHPWLLTVQQHKREVIRGLMDHMHVPT